jgi:hypothetical protein
MKRFLVVITVVAVAALLIFAGATTMSAAPQTNTTTAQWQMNFYPGLDWSGYPVYTQYSNSLNYNWGTGSPAPNVPTSYWSMSATVTAFFYGGQYQFTILADDEFILKVDNVTYMNTINQGLSGKTVVVTVPIAQGNHLVEIDFRQFTGPAYLYTSVTYVKPGPGYPTPTPPPPSRPLPAPLPPASAPSVQTKYGDFTACIQQGLHQADCFHSDGAWNSPDVGSIKMEPKIEIWGNCEPADTDVTWTVDTNPDPMITKDFRCSKTLAGWFAR